MNFFIALIARSMWICTHCRFHAVSISHWESCAMPLVNGGLAKETLIMARKLDM